MTPAQLFALAELCDLYLRRINLSDAANPTFSPPLSAAEQVIFTDLQRMAEFGITANLTLAEFQAIKADLVTARNYVGLASPTAAQTSAALKSTIRVIGALLRA